MFGMLTRKGFALGLLTVLYACGNAQQAEPRDGQPMADIQLTRLDGGVEHFNQWRGKTVVLNIWATWCVPCRREMPDLQKLSERFDPDHFRVVGLSIDDNPMIVKEYLRQSHITYANYIDLKKTMTKNVLGITGVPVTFIVDAKGIIRERLEGYVLWDRKRIASTFPELKKFH